MTKKKSKRATKRDRETCYDSLPEDNSPMETQLASPNIKSFAVSNPLAVSHKGELLEVKAAMPRLVFPFKSFKNAVVAQTNTEYFR